jgi:hypothetical protein
MGNNTLPILKNRRRALLEQKNADKVGAIPSGQAADNRASRKRTHQHLENAGGGDREVEEVAEDVGIQDNISDLPSSVKIILVDIST